MRGLLETYRDLGVFDQHVDEALDTMRDWYDGYRFAANAARSVYNTDMVLYCLNKSVPNRRRNRRQFVEGSAKATRRGPPPTVSAMYCRPSSR